MTIKETVRASAKLGASDALRLAGESSRVTVAKGKKLVAFNMKKDVPSDEDLLAHMLGPTGNLRAPTIRRGKMLVVGFNEDVYIDLVGK